MEFRLTPEQTQEFLDARIKQFAQQVEEERLKRRSDPSCIFPSMESTKELRLLARIDMLQMVRLALLGERFEG